MKIERWSVKSQNVTPLTEKLFKLFVKIISISIAVLEVILIGRVIGGKTFLNT